MEVVAGKNLLKNIHTKVVDDVLLIEDNNTCDFVRGYKHKIKVYVTTPYVKLATNDGVSMLRFDEEFSQDTLVVRITNSGDAEINGTYQQVRSSTHGNGDTYVNGSANSFMIYANGTNYIHAKNLKVRDYIFIQTLTIGDISVNADGVDLFEYDIQTDGNINYTGTPAMIRDVGKTEAKGRAVKAE